MRCAKGCVPSRRSPIRHQGVVVAAVNLASRTHHEFTRQQASLMETLAAEVAGAIARLRGDAALREELGRLRARDGVPGAGGEAGA